MPMVSGGVMARSVVLNGRGGGGGGARTESRSTDRKPGSAKTKSRRDKAGSGTGYGNANGAYVTMDADAVNEPAKPLTAKEQKEAEILAKLHPTVAALVERIKAKKTQPGPDEAKFVRDGKAEIQIWLTDKSPQVIDELKKLGFEVVLDPQSAKMVIGRIAVDKLAALADMKAVRYISPQVSS